MDEPERGVFITLEGGEGAGKSTQLTRLAEKLRAEERTVVTTREPGGTPNAEAIRELVLAHKADGWTPLSDVFLMMAARADHIAGLIEPALASGDWVICDRFSDSTRVYQGIVGGLSDDLITDLHDRALGDTRPDLTLVFDVDPQIGLARVDARAEEKTRFDAQSMAFHRAVRSGFLDIARAEPERCVVIDASAEPDTVTDAVWNAIASAFVEGDTQ